MGWRCDCILGVRDPKDMERFIDLPEEVLDKFEEVSPKNAGIFEVDGRTVNEITVWLIEDALREVSEAFPQYVLTLEMRDPVGDQHMMYLWNGLMYEISAEVTFEPFDFTKLQSKQQEVQDVQ